MASMTMAEKIKDLRLSQGLTLEDVAKKVGVGKSTVRKWETGMIANMRRDKIASLASALHTSPAYLMGWEDNSSGDPIALKKDEINLLSDFNKLNDRGKQKALEDTHNLTLLAAYAKGFMEDTPEHLMPRAAHERTDIDVTEDMRRHDDELMDKFQR